MLIDTIEVDPDTLSTRKTVETSAKEFKTPAKALQVGKLKPTEGEKVSPLARGIAEVYIKTDSTRLANSANSWDGHATNLHQQAKRAEDDEFVVPFVQYHDSADLTPANAGEIAKLQTNYGDILTVPLMTQLVNGAEDGDGLASTHVAAIVENTKVFLEAVENLQISKPVMGVIPPVSKECTDALLEIYREYDIRAYCVDFNRRSPMAQTQLDAIQTPLMRTLESYDIRDRSLVYAINASEGRKVNDTRRTPGALYAYTLGFDVVGDMHISPRYPKEVFERIAAEAEEGDVALRLFEENTLSLVEVAPDDLESFLPDEAEIPADRVQERIDADPDERFRFEKLINAELIGFYLNDEDGIDVWEIFAAISAGSYTEERDLDRVNGLVAEVIDGT